MITVIMKINNKISNILLQIKFYLNRKVAKHDSFLFVFFQTKQESRETPVRDMSNERRVPISQGCSCGFTLTELKLTV